ncbi:hypothetical protein LTR36_006802 [Oleoguttula mirabilis]|uniref:DUF1275 domain protein n=1 Tax=Oleoguttula mirabilis TaxID=1507867 RepID=A0AAV9JC40_9PEZI|nr:hypothetical protein LTR36_006802 [Oleoguttula mirabilis]
MAFSYGTASAGERRPQNGLLDAADEERAALLDKPADSHGGTASRLQKHMTADISDSWGDVALLACYAITGLLDSSSVQVWGSFVSMQTGNTVYLGLGLVAPGDSTRWIRSAISIACFCLGSAFFSTYHRHFSPRKRWVMISSYIIQLLCMIAAALMVSLAPMTTAVSGPVSAWTAVPIALIAFQAGGQAFTSRVLQHTGLTSVVLTSVYCDLFSNPLLGGLTQNVERNRRIAAPLLLLGGAMIGGLWAKTDVGLAGAIWTAVVLKALVTLAWVFWAAAPDDS